MKYGTLIYEDTSSGTNIGDYIQSLAAIQFLPTLDDYISREQLDSYTGESIKLIMNGWFTHHPEHWIPSKNIIPLFVAFHINALKKDAILSQKGIAYLKKHGPIGCRDKYTLELLHSYNIPAYYSSCLTLTLGCKYKVPDNERDDNVYIVDPIFNVPSLKDFFRSPRNLFSDIHRAKSFKDLFIYKFFSKKRILKKIISKNLSKFAIRTHHMLPPNKLSHEKRFEIAEDLIKKYAKAKCVITSRIHCALPCLALGTPVIFINSFSDSSNKSRLEGLIDLFNRIDVDLKNGNIISNFKGIPFPITGNNIIPNPSKYMSYVPQLKQTCETFIN